MAKKRTVFSRRVPDHVTDSLVEVLADGEALPFNALFLKVHENLKLKNAVSGGEEMLRLRCYEKLQRLGSNGLVLKENKTYRGLDGLDQASSANQMARTAAAVAAARSAAAAALDS